MTDHLDKHSDLAALKVLVRRMLAKKHMRELRKSVLEQYLLALAEFLTTPGIGRGSPSFGPAIDFDRPTVQSSH